MSRQTDPIRIDIVSDVVCPWCAVGYNQLANAAQETGIAIDVHWHPFELNPQMAEDGENLREHLMGKYGISEADSVQARQKLTDLGTSLGFAFNFTDDMRMWNTFRAHQLIDWAEDQGKAHDTKLALFEAYFTRRENVGDIKVLAAIAAQVGLNPDDATKMLEEGEKAEIVRQKEQFWTSNGVQGVPAMVFQREHLVTGARGEEGYAAILQQLATQAA